MQQLSIADIFILQLVSEGLGTAYDLHSRGGISVGTAHPALDRLFREGLLIKSKPGERAKAVHRLTTAGKKVLAAERKRPSPEPGEVHIESVLRRVALAVASGELVPAVQLLDKAIASRAANRRQLRNVPKIAAGQSAAEAYTRMKRAVESGHRRAEHEDLARFRRSLAGRVRRS